MADWNFGQVIIQALQNEEDMKMKAATEAESTRRFNKQMEQQDQNQASQDAHYKQQYDLQLRDQAIQSDRFEKTSKAAADANATANKHWEMDAEAKKASDKTATDRYNAQIAEQNRRDPTVKVRDHLLPEFVSRHDPAELDKMLPLSVVERMNESDARAVAYHKGQKAEDLAVSKNTDENALRAFIYDKPGGPTPPPGGLPGLLGNLKIGYEMLTGSEGDVKKAQEQQYGKVEGSESLAQRTAYQLDLVDKVAKFAASYQGPGVGEGPLQEAGAELAQTYQALYTGKLKSKEPKLMQDIFKAMSKIKNIMGVQDYMNVQGLQEIYAQKKAASSGTTDGKTPNP
jgi:hypothetical protein